MSVGTVVFVRGLPADCLESELLALCCPFAVVEKSLLIPQKCQAFVQLPNVQAASNLITFYQSRDALIRGQKVFFEFSSHDEITTRPNYDQAQSATPSSRPSPSQQQYHHQQQPRAAPREHALPSSQQHRQHESRAAPSPRSQYHADPPVHAGGHDGHRRGGTGQQNTILMATVTKIEYDVTVDVLQQVFQKFGNVQKIVTFWKNEEFKALVQMESVDQAQAAQSALDGRDIYTGCNTLSIVFSRHPELRVRFNNERSRDYTNPNLPSGPAEESGGAGSSEMLYDQEPQAPGMLGDVPSRNGPSPGGRGGSNYDRQSSQQSGGGRNDYDQRGPPSRDYGRDDQYRPDRSDIRGMRGASPRYGDNVSERGDRSRGGDIASPTATSGGPIPVHSTGRSVRHDTKRSPVLICSGMDRSLVNPDRLFTFFGCFGDVVRVKIMFRKQDTALIQFVDEVHATSALDHLDGVFVFGKKLRVDFSKHTSVSMPRGDVDRFELENTRDFTGSPLHRYRRRSPHEAVSPVPLLHISGIPMELQRNQNTLIDLFAQYGFVKNFHYIQKNTKMALLEMGSLDEAIMALLSLDNISYPDSHMRVSFSKASPVALAQVLRRRRQVIIMAMAGLVTEAAIAPETVELLLEVVEIVTEAPPSATIAEEAEVAAAAHETTATTATTVTRIAARPHAIKKVDLSCTTL
uniref:RRM domain-containing protein n=1 Tax=Globisporangium ultimum (strain ATCC 200006 / CBS 805.95 / DAOM BR144) TaxID=431595 RepID=K3WYT6_GLOUD